MSQYKTIHDFGWAEIENIIFRLLGRWSYPLFVYHIFCKKKFSILAPLKVVLLRLWWYRQDFLLFDSMLHSNWLVRILEIHPYRPCSWFYFSIGLLAGLSAIKMGPLVGDQGGFISKRVKHCLFISLFNRFRGKMMKSFLPSFLEIGENSKPSDRAGLRPTDALSIVVIKLLKP